MKKNIFTTLIISSGMALSTSTVAGWNSVYGSDNNNTYKSSYGNRYQYDLSNSTDRNRYDLDYSAQIRDEISVNPTRDLDEGIGQYGAGIYNY